MKVNGTFLLCFIYERLGTGDVCCCPRVVGAGVAFIETEEMKRRTESHWRCMGRCIHGPHGQLALACLGQHQSTPCIFCLLFFRVQYLAFSYQFIRSVTITAMHTSKYYLTYLYLYCSISCVFLFCILARKSIRGTWYIILSVYRRSRHNSFPIYWGDIAYPRSGEGAPLEAPRDAIFLGRCLL